MKYKIILWLAIAFTISTSHAENRIKINIDCQTPGTLSNLITYVDRHSVTDLYVSGYINKTDFTFINQIVSYGNVKVVDLSQANYTGREMTLNFVISCKTDDGNTVYKSIERFSMPKSTEFISNISENTHIDTLQINSKYIVELRGYYNIKKIEFSDNVEEIWTQAFFESCTNGVPQDYLIDKFPKSLKKINANAFYHDGAYGGNSPKFSRTINPNIKLPNDIVQIGGNKEEDKKLDYYSSTYGSWIDTMVKVRGNTISFPNSLRIFNGMNIHKGTYMAFTEFECDTLILHRDIEYFSAGVKSKVLISEIAQADNIKWDKIYIDKLYVPNNALDRYESVLFWDLDVNDKHVKEILPIVEVSAIKINGAESIYAGETIQLQYALSPADALNRNIVWKSSDESIASVSGLGVLTAKCPGRVIISATTDNGTVGHFETNILQHASGIEINPSNVTLENGNSMQLQCIFNPENTSNKNVKWSSSSPNNICHVSDKGLITALSPGICIVTAISEDGSFSAECKITVIQSAQTIAITPKVVELHAGDSFILHAEIEPSTTSDKSITWNSSDESIATVNEHGQITAIAGGKVRISATSNSNINATDFCEVTVVQPVLGISLNETAIELFTGDCFQLSVIFNPSEPTNKNIKWSSTDSSIAIVSGNGMVYGITEGACSIIATSEDGNFIAICKVKVKDRIIPVTSIIFDETNLTGKVSDELTIGFTVLPENATDKTLTWSSSNESIAYVNNNGLIQLRESGTAIISAKSTDGSNIKADCVVVVSENSGIESIIEDKTSHVKIFDIHGHLIYDGIYSEAKIEPGIYILMYNGRNFKVKIK
jgi:Ig domain protein group 2 domain protein